MGLHGRFQRLSPLLLMAASGFAGLGYQIVWTQQFALWLGHESAAVLAVVTAFFGGLALGALALGPRIERSAVPVRWYAGCELAIAAWSGVLALGMAPFSEALLGLTGVQPAPAWQWAVAFCGSFVVLLPATVAMGATLPAMARITGQLQREGRSIAPLYAANTFGAVVGVLAAAFWLVPGFGLVRTAGVCAGLNLCCGVVALWLFRRDAPPASEPGPRHGVLLAWTGLLGIGYEVLVVRVLSQVSEDTVYTFALLLAVYLVGSALGAAAYQRWPRQRRDRLLCALALACLIGTASLWAAEALMAALPAGFGLVGEGLLALAAFGLPTFVMGALFSHLASGGGLSRALGINMLGAAAAPLLFGVLLLPLLGSKAVLLLIAVGYLLPVAVQRRAAPAVWVPATVAAALAAFTPSLAFVDVPDGGQVVSYREGVMAAVSVVEDAGGVSRLRINNRQQEGSSATRFVDGRQALLPLLLHPAPQRALFLGLGTGVTASTAALDAGLQVDAVELLPEVIEASSHFTPAGPRLHLMAADARRYVRATDRRYDVVVADNFHPARSGSGALYTVEHFRAVRSRLADAGLFCQWLPLHQLDRATLRSIVTSFVAVYPDGRALLASNSLETPVIGLVGTADGHRFDPAVLRARLQRAALPPGFGLDDEFALLGSFVAGPAALAAFAGDAVLNTDDHPVVAYSAPRATYAPAEAPRERLVALLRELSVVPDDVIAPMPDGSTWPDRLAAYWAARNRFVEAGRSVRPAADVTQMLAQVREPLLAVLRISPDFRPAAEPLARMAAALARTDAPAAQALLDEIASTTRSPSP